MKQNETKHTNDIHNSSANNTIINSHLTTTLIACRVFDILMLTGTLIDVITVQNLILMFSLGHHNLKKKQKKLLNVNIMMLFLKLQKILVAISSQYDRWNNERRNKQTF